LNIVKPYYKTLFSSNVAGNTSELYREESSPKNNNLRNIFRRLELLINSPRYWFNYMKNQKSLEIQLIISNAC